MYTSACLVRWCGLADCLVILTHLTSKHQTSQTSRNNMFWMQVSMLAVEQHLYIKTLPKILYNVVQFLFERGLVLQIMYLQILLHQYQNYTVHD